MSNINKTRKSGFAIRVNLFFGMVFLILALGRTWGLMDEYLVGRFTMFSALALTTLFFVKKPQPDLKLYWIDLAFALYYLISCISLLWAHTASAGFLTVQTILLSLVYYLLFRQLPEIVNHSFLFGCLLSASLMILFIAFVQVLVLGSSAGLAGNHIYEITGWVGHKNLIASLLFLLFCSTVYYANAIKANFAVYSMLLVEMTFMVLMQSRATILALFLYLALIIGYTIWTKGMKNPFIKRLSLFLGMAIVLGVSTFFLLGGKSEDLGRLNPGLYVNSASGAERRFVWFKTRELIKDNWVTGYGAGNWKLFFPSKSIEGSYRLQTQNIIFTRAHNDFLEIFSETGLIGLLLYLSIFISAIGLLISSFKTALPEDRFLSVLLTGALIGYLVIAFFDFPKERMEHQIVLSLIFAICALQFEKSRAKETGVICSVNSKWINSILTPLLVLNLVIGIYTIKGEYHVRKAMEAKARSDWKKVEDESKLAYSPFFQIDPVATSVKWMEGLALYSQGKYAQAEQPLSLACKHTPFQYSTLNDYASCLVHQNKFKEAIDVYKKVLFINPRFEDAMFNISYTYAQVQDFDKAIEWVQKTKLLPDKKENFLRQIESMKSMH